MGRATTIHLIGPASLHEAVDCVTEILGFRPERRLLEEEGFAAWVLALDLRVYDSTYEDDQGIDLSRYPYVIDLEIFRDRLFSLDEAAQFRELAAQVVARYCYREKQWQCIVVDNLQRLIARYPERE